MNVLNELVYLSDNKVLQEYMQAEGILVSEEHFLGTYLTWPQITMPLQIKIRITRDGKDQFVRTG